MHLPMSKRIIEKHQANDKDDISMDQIVQEFLASFESIRRSVHLQYEIIDQLAAEGKTEILYELGAALEAHAGQIQSRLWAVESVYDHLERVLALTPGITYARTLMELALLSRTRTMRFPWSLDERSRLLAPLLASAQSIDVLLDLISVYGQNQAYAEFICVLVQEMVLRGVRCDEIPLIVDFINQMRKVQHPLAWLPLRLLEIENGLPLPSYSISGSAFVSPEIEIAASAEEEVPAQLVSEISVTVEESTTDPERDKILTAVAPWSNARVEARIFSFNQSITGSHISDSLLLSMDLACLKGVSANDIFLNPLSPQNVFRVLFTAASQGGAYDNGYYGAYGRLATWSSLFGLVGTSKYVDEDLASLIEQSRWFSFYAKSKWFYGTDSMWDVGILTLRPDRISIAVLAATSTDSGSDIDGFE